MPDKKITQSPQINQIEKVDAMEIAYNKAGIVFKNIANFVGGIGGLPVIDRDEFIEKVKKDAPQLIAKQKAREQRYEAYEKEYLKDLPDIGVFNLTRELGYKVVAKIGFLFQDEEPAAQQIKDHRPLPPKGAGK